MFVQIRSKNKTANDLRNKISCKVRTIFRLGSMTSTEEIFPKGVKLGKEIREINTVKACHNSGNKILMKQCFDKAGVKSSEWKQLNEVFEENNVADWDFYPAIIKHKNSSKGNGIFYIENAEQLFDFKKQHNNPIDYVIEKYYTYEREYRLHVTKDGCFYTCRKMLKKEAEVRWHRHDMNSVWILEENELFNKPANWDKIVAECVKAMESVGLDISAVDIKVSSKDPRNFIILETNSGPSMGAVTSIKYIEQLKKMVE